MKVHFLGTNGWFDTRENNTMSTMLETKDCYILLDAGYGITKSLKYLKKQKPIYLFISHFHLDHICGLHTLPLFNKTNLQIFVPQGMKKYFKIIGSAPFTGFAKHFEVTEVKVGHHSVPIKFDCLKLKHAIFTLGYRFYLENKIITYCCDTAVCPNDFELGKNADLLIHECSFMKGHSGEWGHSNPMDTAKMAKKAGVKQLVLTHFAASTFNNQGRKKAENLAKKYFDNTLAAKDGLVVSL